MTPPAGPVPTPAGRRRWLRLVDNLFQYLTALLAFAIVAVLAAFVVVLVEGSTLTLNRYGFAFLTGSNWDPEHAIFGTVPFVVGTILTSAIALVIAVPLSIGIAIFLSELAPGWIATPLGYVVELLAAVPSVVFGFWGFAVLVPFLRFEVDPGLHAANQAVSNAIHYPLPFFSGSSSGQDLFSAGVILAIMIVPTIAAITRESLRAVPVAQREAALSLGATRWEATRLSVLSYARIGILGAIILGLGRALGETMAVTMTIGNHDALPTSLFSQGQTIASLIATEFFANPPGSPEVSALIEAGLVLLTITLAINVLARLFVWRLVRTTGGGAIE
ncbi:MAG TPA: phosphate ABC transporter permease subunit PstC [Thermoplasmata archaeon]|nr:phosphate ABC transporter permease subunit PstC [Thermoplasmata archaeon]